MCGIVGLISRRKSGFFYNDLEMFEGLLVMDGWFRGMDSTGAFCVHSNGQVQAIKHASHPLHTFESEEWGKFKSKSGSSGHILIGHNRKATQGTINSDNAHPFIENNIILVHNGTLNGHKTLADREVDSHAVCAAFAEKPHQEVLADIDGAFAFVWYDTVKERLYAIRNDDRPLSLVLTNEVIAVASEAWMPAMLFRRQNKEITETIHIESGVLYEFSLSGAYWSTKVKLKEKIPVTDVASRVWYGGYTEYEGKDERSKQTTQTSDDSCDVEEPLVTRLPTILQNRSSQACNEDAKVKMNEEIIVVFDRFRMENDKRVKAFGKVSHPGKPDTDVVCFLPSIVDITEAHEWAKVPVKTTVSTVVPTSCGNSIWVREPKIQTQIKTNNDEISSYEWKHVCENLSCNHCNAQIHSDEALFTTVTKKRGGLYKITCPECVMDKLPDGEIKDAFIKRRNIAIQDREHVGPELIVSPDGKVGVESTTTVH